MALDEADLSGSSIGVYWVAYLDIDGDPVRASTLPFSYAFSGTGDADLDGYTFEALDGNLVEIGAVVHGKGGSDTLSVSLRGLPGVDDDLLTALETRANWQGRTARLWHGILSGSTVGTPQPYYTGWMNKISDMVAPDTRTVTVEIENYLAALTSARGRTYQNQTEHDAGDLSPLRMRSSANGTAAANVIVSSGGSREPRADRQYEQIQ